MSLRRKIYFVIIGASTLALVSTVVITTLYSISQTREQIYSYLTSSGRARAEHVRTFLQERVETSEFLAASSVHRDFLLDPSNVATRDKIDKRLARTLEIDEKDIYEVFILDESGLVAASTDKEQEGKDKSNDPYFTKAQNNPYIKDTYFSETVDKLTYTVSAPILDESKGRTLGVSVVRYNPTSFFEMVKSENGMGKTEENFLINADKYFLTPSLFLGAEVVLSKKVETENSAACFEPSEIDYTQRNGYSGLRDFQGNKSIVQAQDYRGIDVLAVHHFIPETNWCLITKVDRSELYRSINNYIALVSVISSLSLVGFLLISKKVTSYLLNPIADLVERIKLLEANDFQAVSAPVGQGEIGSLYRAFNEMALAITNTRQEMKDKLSLQEKGITDQQSAILNVLEDVQEERDNSQRTADELKKFQMAVDGASDHIVITDINGVVFYANDSVTRITGYPKNEVIGKKAGSKDLWGGQMPLEVYKDFWNTIKVEKKPFIGTFHNIRKDGTHYEAGANVTPIIDLTGNVVFFVGIERDITKEKEIDIAKTEFVSLASHQLRTPLSAINWYTEMLLAGDAGKINKQQKEFLDEIYRGNKRMVDLVSSLLNVSRLDLGTFQIEPEPIKMCIVVDDVADEMKHMLDEKGISFSNMCPIDNLTVNADPKLIRIIIQNLLSNAIKYTPEKGKISISMVYNPKSVKEAYVIKVSDTGYGIPANQQDKIFTKLFRADNVRALDTEGTGLGLYIIKSIMEESGGSISFISTEGKGTTFIVKIPRSGMKQRNGEKSIEETK